MKNSTKSSFIDIELMYREATHNNKTDRYTLLNGLPFNVSDITKRQQFMIQYDVTNNPSASGMFHTPQIKTSFVYVTNEAILLCILNYGFNCCEVELL